MQKGLDEGAEARSDFREDNNKSNKNKLAVARDDERVLPTVLVEVVTSS